MVAVTAITVGAACAGASAADFNGAMLKDLNTAPQGSNPADFTTVGGKSFFVADEPGFGPELWTSDGTESGTAIVKDINPGGNGAFGYSYGSGLKFAEIGGVLYFAADDGTNGTELWKSDGTAAGTQLVKDIRPGGSSYYYSNSSSPSDLTVVGSTLYFTADDGTNGRELWKSDGTAAGTQLVKDINTGGYYGYGYGSRPSGLTAVGSTLYFSANDGTNGTELWKSDGTDGGTQLVKDIRPGSSGSFSGYGSVNFTAVGTTLYFSANDGTNGNELWKSDGTDGGTTLVKDIRPGSYYYGGYGASSRPGNLTVVGSTLYFSANDGTNGTELWKSDGSDVGTTLVKDIRPGGYGSLSSYYGPQASFAAVGSTLYFSANDGTNGRELWKSDGTDGGTQLVENINTTTSTYYGNEYGSNPTSLTAVGNTLYFSADDGTNGRELWESDVGAGGADLVKDINPGSDGSLYSSSFAVAGGRLHFSANDGSTGLEPWVSDGTVAGTELTKDINTWNQSSYPRQLTDFNGTLFFEADSNDGSFWEVRRHLCRHRERRGPRVGERRLGPSGDYERERHALLLGLQ